MTTSHAVIPTEVYPLCHPDRGFASGGICPRDETKQIPSRHAPGLRISLGMTVGRAWSWTATSKTPRGDRRERERGRIVTSEKSESSRKSKVESEKRGRERSHGCRVVVRHDRWGGRIVTSEKSKVESRRIVTSEKSKVKSGDGDGVLGQLRKTKGERRRIVTSEKSKVGIEYGERGGEVLRGRFLPGMRQAYGLRSE